MKNVSKLLVFLLAVCMVFTLCACTQDGADNDDTTPSETETKPTESQQPSETEADGKVTYTVTVQDESGKAVAGAVVQLCKDTCIPSVTDENGSAQFKVTEDDYKVSVTQAPKGFAADATEYHFEEGSYELTIILKAAE